MRRALAPILSLALALCGCKAPALTPDPPSQQVVLPDPDKPLPVLNFELLSFKRDSTLTFRLTNHSDVPVYLDEMHTRSLPFSMLLRDQQGRFWHFVTPLGVLINPGNWYNREQLHIPPGTSTTLTVRAHGAEVLWPMEEYEGLAEPYTLHPDHPKPGEVLDWIIDTHAYARAPWPPPKAAHIRGEGFTRLLR